MLTITFYANCRLNNSYLNVLSGRKSDSQGVYKVLDLYLDTFSKFTITSDAISYENKGELIIDTYPEQYINMYNYMKVVISEGQVGITDKIKYCFINNVELKNGCAYLSYEEDIWSTYGAGILINNGYLSRSRVREYFQFTPSLVKLPINYDGNNELDLNYTEDNSAYCIVELQLFNLTAGNEIGNRWTYYCVLSNWSGTTFAHSKSALYKKLRIAFSFSAGLQLDAYVDSVSISSLHTDLYFSIGDVYILPSSFDIDSFIDKTQYVARYVQSGTTAEDWPCFYKLKDTNLDNYETVLSGNITNDYKNLSFGTFCSQIKIENNGMNIPYKFQITHDAANFALRLSIQNQVVDLTEDFRCHFPFTPITADGYAQRKIALAVNNANLDAQAFKSGVYFGNAAHGSGISWGQNLLTFAEEDRLSLGGLQTTSNYTALGLGSIADLYRIGKTKEEINKPIYSSAQANWGNHKQLANYYVPFVLCKINPSNAEFVKQYINNNGYAVYEYLYNFSLLDIDRQWNSRPYNYNVIKFDYVDVYGRFPKDIGNRLASILMRGVTIWFDENFTDDNYVV